MAVRQVAHEDFLEGVRAALVDKDRRPAWLAETGHPHLSTAAAAAALPEDQTEVCLPGNRFSLQQLFEPLGGKDHRHHLLL